MSTQSDSSADAQQRFQRLLDNSVLWLFAGTLFVGISLILAFNLVAGPQVLAELGEPAPEDVLAPQSVTYFSEVLSEQARQQAAGQVADIYTSVDLTIGRAQSNKVRTLFTFIDVVRADTMATYETRLEYLKAIEMVSIDDQVADDLLSLDQVDFATAQADVLRIVEETMREGITEDRLSDFRRQASRGFSFDLTPRQERVVTTLAPQFIAPNTFLDQAATAERREEVMAAVEPVSQIVTRDEQILRVGEIVDAEDLEKLEELGLLRQTINWRQLIGVLLAAAIMVTIITLYWHQFFMERRKTGRLYTVLVLLILLFVLVAKLMIPGRAAYVYLYPAAALSMLVAVIFDVRLSLVVTLVTAGLVGFIGQGSLELAIYTGAGGSIAVLMLRDTQRINALFRAGLVTALVNVAVILMFRLTQDIELTELMQLLLFAVLNGPIISSSLTLAGIFVIGSVFGITTTLQLQELSRLDHPLLQELLRRAPGTYHHSVVVANLAEQAAESVKANSTLVRVGAFYHDVGKMNRAPFFIENQNGGNPHEGLDPVSSARIIKSHVTDGLDLARRYRLPGRVRDFIAEHHGDRVLKVFYNNAVEAAGGEPVDIEQFRYPGPRPSSRETGIVQLADAIEATSSALRPNAEEDIEKLVNGIVDDHLKEGQLDNSGLTLGDIKRVKQSFIKTLKGRFHVRVRYPGNEDLVAERAEEKQVAAAPQPPEVAEDAADVAEPVSREGLMPANPLAVTEEVDEPA